MVDTQNEKAPTKNELKGRLIFSPIMIILGSLIFIFASYPKLQQAKATKSWDQAEGRITSTYIVAHKDGHILPLGSDRPEHYRGEEGVKFRVVTGYDYTVDGIEYEGYKRLFMQSKRDGYKKYSRAERWRNHYLTNNEVEVFYDPENPREAVLRKGLRIDEWLLLNSPLVMPFIGILLLIGLVKSKLK